jgi:2-keto-4-pentenoate hydratase/2-oxohepta-3-ene-1,7-dioic acid hydratase in catechol pathway
VQLFTTEAGLARRRGECLEVLDIDVPGVHEAIIGDRLDDLGMAPVRESLQLAETKLLLPVRPRSLIQVGLNYESHLKEIGQARPDTPMFRISDPTEALSGPDAVVELPAEASEQVDHECEIAVVFGAPARSVSADRAWDVIAGVTACNDVSARDLQRAGFATGDYTAGKMLPGFKPMGPGLLTSDEVRDGTIDISLTVNGEIRQRADTSELVFSIPDLVEIVTADHTFDPGDVMITGSPSGVGFFTGLFLQPGDIVEVTVADLPPLRTIFERATS